MQKEMNTEQTITLVGLTWRSRTEDFGVSPYSHPALGQLLQDDENTIYRIDVYWCLEELVCIISDVKVNKNIQSPLTQLKLGRVSLLTLSSFLFEKV